MITTKRLFLIPWHASDADELYELAKDPEIGPLCGWEPHKTLEDSKQVLANVLSDKSCYAVKDMKTGHVIGSMSLNFEEISDFKGSLKAAAPGRNWLLDWSSLLGTRVGT
ncbi:GNAT family N-acetyltransferase [Lancefieldella parvula]